VRFLLAMLVFLLASWQVRCQEPPESLAFAIYHVSGDGRDLIDEGKRDYTVSDIDVTPWGIEDGYQTSLKSLELSGGFRIGIHMVRQHKADAFGLWIRNDQHPDGFSWEWFNFEDGDIFKRWQGPEQVRVTYAQIAKGVEIRSIEFLTDVMLRFKEDQNTEPGIRTHEIVVSKGSVLRFAP
jgi:hypothetical protein